MTDERLRRLKREAAAGDPQAEALLLIEYVRAGDSEAERMRIQSPSLGTVYLRYIGVPENELCILDTLGREIESEGMTPYLRLPINKIREGGIMRLLRDLITLQKTPVRNSYWIEAHCELDQLIGRIRTGAIDTIVERLGIKDVEEDDELLPCFRFVFESTPITIEQTIFQDQTKLVRI